MRIGTHARRRRESRGTRTTRGARRIGLAGRRVVFFLALLLAAGGTTSILLADDELPHAAPVRPVANTAGFHAKTRLVLTAEPEEPRLLETIYVFPDRARWTTRWEKDRARRETTFRYGVELWRVPPRTKASIALEGKRRDGELVRGELRRAAFFWPDGFAWSEAAPGGSDAARVVTAPVLRSHDEGATRIGTLRACLDETGRPQRIDAVGTGAMVGETVVIEGWREVQGRSWPEKCAWHRGGRRVAAESLESVERRVEFLDKVFLPIDRRAEVHPTVQAKVLTRELPPVVVRIHPLPGGIEWEKAIERFHELREAAEGTLEATGARVDAFATFGLDLHGRPVEVILRLEREPAEVPAGWTKREARHVKLIMLGGLSAVDRLRVGLLLRDLPRGTRPERPYVRIWGNRRVQIALPYGP